MREEPLPAIVPSLRMRPISEPTAPLFEPMAERRVLVTGGAGFVGAALCARMAMQGAELHVLDDLSSGHSERLENLPGVTLHAVDVSRTDRVARVLLDEGPFDVIFHLAARVGVRTVLADPEEARRVNEDVVKALIGALRLLPSAERPRLFAASSSEVYGDASSALEECSRLRSERGVGRWAYAASKVRAERLLDEARELWPRGAGPVHLRFFNVVGPGQDADAGFVLPRFVEAAMKGESLHVYGDGSAIRTYAHVDEVAETLSLLASHPALPEGPLNIGGVARASVLELANAVIEASGRELELKLIDPRDEIGELFEEVAVRVPALERLAVLGCGVPSMDLQGIVADTFARHAELLGSIYGRDSCESRPS